MYKPRLLQDFSKQYLQQLFFHKGKLKEDTHPAKWRWTCVKQSGARPTTRSGLSLAVVPGNRALCFGGVFDEVSLVLDIQIDGLSLAVVRVKRVLCFGGVIG